MAEAQASTVRCKECGRRASVTATDNPYNFDVVCTCGYAGSIAWSTKGPAPVFAGAQTKGESDAVSR